MNYINKKVPENFTTIETAQKFIINAILSLELSVIPIAKDCNRFDKVIENLENCNEMLDNLKNSDNTVQETEIKTSVPSNIY